MAQAPVVSIITVFHQRRAIARDFLHAWQREAAARLPVELLFGDNASTDGTEQLLADATSFARVEHFGTNLGFARANNRLARAATADTLLFLNYDVGLCPDWLHHLLAAFTNRPKLGVVGNVQLSVRAQAPDHAGVFFGPDGAPYHFRPSLAQLQPLDLLPVPAVTGACLAIRRSLFERIGGFHEGYQNSYEDIELCLRARELGSEVAVATRSRIWHYIGVSPGRQTREDANASLFAARCGSLARELSRYAPPDLAAFSDTPDVQMGGRTTFETLQVYPGSGDTFSEQNSTVHLHELGRWNRVEVPLVPAPGSPAPAVLRLDPLRCAGVVRFGGCALKHRSTRRSLTWADAETLAAAAHIGGTARPIATGRGLTLESSGEDPQITVDLNTLFPGSNLNEDFVLEFWVHAVHAAPAPTAKPPAPARRRFWSIVADRRRVLVDLLRLSPGGINGGVKVFVNELLAAIADRHRRRLEIRVLAIPDVCDEASLRRSRVTWCAAVDTQSPTARQELKRADVLYAPLGFSALARPGLPQVSLFVDLLHRDIARALPDAEIAAREEWFVETIRGSAVLQCNSQFVVDRLHHHYGHPEVRTLVVYNAVGQSKRRASSVTSEPPYFFYPANDWPHKNHERLIEAYGIYRARTAGPWGLKLSGHFADRARIERAIAAADAGSHVQILGHLPDEPFNRVFATAGALVFPSRYEGFGIPVLEAFRLGVPVLCSRAASLPEVGGEACTYFDPDDIESIAGGMARMSSDTVLRDRLITRGLRRATEFDLGREADKLASEFIRLTR